MDRPFAVRFLEKVRRFASTELDDDERRLLATLIAPAVAQLYGGEDPGGPLLHGWTPAGLPSAIVDAARTSALQVVGLTH